MPKSDFKLEICVENIQSAINAQEGGADRIELCQAYECGGLTPSIGLVKSVKENVSIPVFMMIRPRMGDFEYSDLELSLMEEDIRFGLSLGVDGFVFGALRDKRVDKEACRRLMNATKGLPVTFHRAFDHTNYDEAIEEVVEMGFTRILTSGWADTALAGLEILKFLVKRAQSRVIIMAGSGVSERNIVDIADFTGVKEFHSSAQSPLKKIHDDSIVKGTSSYPLASPDVIRGMRVVMCA